MGKRSSKPAKAAGPTEVQSEDSGKEWHEKDTEQYRKGYPDKKDFPDQNKNKLFYFNQLEAEPDGLKIEDIHEQWSREYEKLEEQHGYIQWLFPIREAGLNQLSQELQLHEIEAIVGDADAKRRVLTSYKIMLDFYGMKMKDEETGELERADNWESRFKHLNESFHNYLRITRILKCIGELGYERLKPGFVKFVVKEGFVEGTLGNLMESCERYWIGVIRDDAIRAEILDHFNREKRAYEEKLPVEKGEECVPDSVKGDGDQDENKPSSATDNKAEEVEADKEMKSNPDESVKTERNADESQKSTNNEEEITQEVDQVKEDKDEKSTEVKSDSAGNAREDDVVQDKTPESNSKSEAVITPEEDNSKDLAGDDKVTQKENEEAVTKPDEDHDKETIESKTEQNDATVMNSEETPAPDTKSEHVENNDAKIDQDEDQTVEKVTTDSKIEPKGDDEAVTESVIGHDKEDGTIAKANGIENEDSGVTVESKTEPEGDNKVIADTDVKSEESDKTEKDERSEVITTQDGAVGEDDTKEEAVRNDEAITEPTEKPEQDNKKDEDITEQGETKKKESAETAEGPGEVVDADEKTKNEISEQKGTN